MKKLHIFLIVAAVGYFSGLGLEVIAEGSDSKFQKLISNASFESYDSPQIIKGAYLLNNEMDIDAEVGFEIVPITVGTGTDAILIDTPVCKFHAPADIDTQCVICVLNGDPVTGEGTGLGRIDFGSGGYMSSDTINIPITEFEVIEDIDVKNLHSVLIAICLPGGEGCTPGYWKQMQHFVDWPDTGPTESSGTITITQSTFFSAVFDRSITVKVDGAPVTGPTLLQALKAQGGGINALARHTVAAYLNSLTTLFSISAAGVIDDFIAAFDSGDFETQKNIFDELNNADCPFGNNPLDNSEDASFSETGGVDPLVPVTTPVTPYEKFVYSRDQLQTLLGQTSNSITQSDLTNAISLLSAVIDDSSYWVNDYHLDTVTGQIVLDNTRDAIDLLYFITTSGNETTTFNDSVQAVIDELIAAAITLAQNAIDDVNACGGENPKIAGHLSNAQTKLSQAITDSNDKKYNMAVNKFFDAWYETFLATESCPDGYWTPLDGYQVVVVP